MYVVLGFFASVMADGGGGSGVSVSENDYKQSELQRNQLTIFVLLL